VADHAFSNIPTVYSGVASGHAFPQISLLKQCFIYLKALKIYNYHIVILSHFLVFFNLLLFFKKFFAFYYMNAILQLAVSVI
jgi:hypothetical protein